MGGRSSPDRSGTEDTGGLRIPRMQLPGYKREPHKMQLGRAQPPHTHTHCQGSHTTPASVLPWAFLAVLLEFTQNSGSSEDDGALSEEFKLDSEGETGRR